MGWTLGLVRGVRRGREAHQRVAYHWRPEDYLEDDDHLRQEGPYQATNAPRWFARGQLLTQTHLRIGTWTGHSFVHGESLAEIEARLGRALGVAQMKLTGFAGGGEAEAFRLTCVLADSSQEEREVRLEGELDSADAVPVTYVDKLAAERKPSPYRGVGLFRDVVSVERVGDPPAAPRAFDIVADVPFLHREDGVAVSTGQRTPVAVQMSGQAQEVHLFDDAVGRLYLFYDRDGDIFFRRREGLPAGWGEERQLTAEGTSCCPWADKDDQGQTTLLWTSGESETEEAQSADDGELWERV